MKLWLYRFWLKGFISNTGIDNLCADFEIMHDFIWPIRFQMFHWDASSCTRWNAGIKVTSHQRHVISTYQILDYIFSNLFRLTTKTPLKPHITAPHERPVIRNEYPCNDVVMWRRHVSGYFFLWLRGVGILGGTDISLYICTYIRSIFSTASFCIARKKRTLSVIV